MCSPPEGKLPDAASIEEAGADVAIDSIPGGTLFPPFLYPHRGAQYGRPDAWCKLMANISWLWFQTIATVSAGHPRTRGVACSVFSDGLLL